MSVKNILVSQNPPRVMAQFDAVRDKFGVNFEFRPFFESKPLSVNEFRQEKINIPDYTAIIFSSRHSIDAFFQLCEQLRFKVPDSQKYFCASELVAMYLQKHIVYRKRKIFYGDGSASSIVSLIGPRHKGEKFLIAASDSSSNDTLIKLLKAQEIDCTEAIFVKSESRDLKDLNLHSYDMVVLYNQADVKSIYENFPEFSQENIKFVAYGKNVAPAMEEAGLEITVKAPTPEAPSVAKAIELYLESCK